MIRWADERFLYYVKKQGEKPVRKPGLAYAKHSMKGSLQHVLAFLMGGAFLFIMIYVIDDLSKTESPLRHVESYGRSSLPSILSFLLPISYGRDRRSKLIAKSHSFCRGTASS